MFRQVPVLPVVVPLAAAVLIALLWRLHRRDHLTTPRAAVALALCVYAAGVVANTVFPIFLDKPPRDAPWTASLSLVPLAGYDPADALMNVVVFVPLGVLLSLLLARPSWWRVMLVAACASLAIELTQLLTAYWLAGGHVADLNDLVFNILGAGIGLGLLSTVSRVPGVARIIDRFRWR